MKIKNKHREMDCRLRVCVKKLCKICSKWPIRVIYFKVTTLVFLYKILLMKLQFRSVKELSGRTKLWYCSRRVYTHAGFVCRRPYRTCEWLERICENRSLFLLVMRKLWALRMRVSSEGGGEMQGQGKSRGQGLRMRQYIFSQHSSKLVMHVAHSIYT